MTSGSKSSTTAIEAVVQEPPGQFRIALWLMTAMLTGGVIMGLELAAFRLYAPYFGYSIYVWGSMISVVMAALSGGYALGGWLADRSQNDTPLYSIVLGSGIYQLIIVCTMGPLLSSLGKLGEFSGTVLATLIIFTPPMTALAITSPYVIRLLARAGHVGITAGRVYALSTVGSIAGILATVFFLVPSFGTRVTLLVLCALSALIGVSGLAVRRRTAWVGLLPLAVIPFTPKAKLPFYEVWRTESVYNMVRVIRYKGYMWLALNDARLSHTTRKENSIWSGSYQDEFALGPLLVRAHRLLVLGMGAGGSIAATRQVASNIQVDAVEIDPKVVEAAERFFGLHADPNWLRVHVADARPWLGREHASYELVHVDLYQGGPYVPFYLITEEFFRQILARLSDDGLVMMNVYDRGKNRELLYAAGATLRRVFPTVVVLSRPDENHILFAFRSPRSVDSIRTALRNTGADRQIALLAEQAASTIADLVPPAGTPVFTDDRAPIEEMTRRMLQAREP